MSSATKVCTVCHKPATQHCSRCSEGLNENGEPLPSPTYYCSKACQKADFQDHKAKCRIANARKQLYRGALLVQEAFYAVREAAFDVHILKLRKEDSKIHLYGEEVDDGPLSPFPNHLPMSGEDKKALLTWQACGDAAAYMAKLVEKILDGITSEKSRPTEPTVIVKDNVKSIIQHLPDGSIDSDEYERKVVRVSLKNGEQYILDPAGAQFRQYCAVLPLDQYHKAYVKQCCSDESLGYYAIRWDRMAKYRDDSSVPIDFDYRRVWISNEIAKAMNEKREAWEIETSKTVAAILNQKQTQFDTDKAAFLQAITTTIGDWIKSWEAKGKVIPPAEPRGEPQTLGDLLDQRERDARGRN